MQAVKAHEARIIDALQRNCVKAFIVIMDGQTPEKKKKKPPDVFPSLFYFPPQLKIHVWDHVQEESPRISDGAG